ncbi:hypothetical protein O6H91_04G119400 [Diphasiastrum complanatum]|uniref:Uncharacterized protein n=1 Tax=Diphasiastrum complanatum TaxID=34168 RepID=A0ACC2E179_DIPCM|nr:hypothetical protein O6H91_04G119400 [Diphasiastrum complanatum]
MCFKSKLVMLAQVHLFLGSCLTKMLANVCKLHSPAKYYSAYLRPGRRTVNAGMEM